MRRIVLTTIGTLGDLHPFIAIGLALEKRGFTPVLAVPEDQVAKCRRAGLEAIAVRPGFDSIAARMGLSKEEAIRQIVADQRVMLEQVVLPGLSESTEALDRAVAGAEAIVASTFVFAAPIVAEKRDLPLISVILQPMAMLSVYDPPRTPDFWMMVGAPANRYSRLWNHTAYTAIRRVLHGLYGKQVDAVRAEHDLPPKGARRLLEPCDRSVLRLGCYSPQLAAAQPDAPASARIVGFPVFDSNCGTDMPLAPEIAAFLTDGAPPLVFTLGTFAVNSAGEFYDMAAEAARRLGMRAILLVGGDQPLAIEGDILRCGYAPHSQLFAKAAAVIHHGGVGTTGQALRAGKPQLVVPHMGDQFDQAHRIKRMGVGLRLKAQRFKAGRAARRIARLLNEPEFGVVATEIASRMAGEGGADAAADAIAQVLNADKPGHSEPAFDKGRQYANAARDGA